RNHRLALRLQVRVERLHDEEFPPFERIVLHRRHDVADDARELHKEVASSRWSVASNQPQFFNWPLTTGHWPLLQSLMKSTVSMTPMIAASTGLSFMPSASRALEPATTRTRSWKPAPTVSTATT